MPRMVATAIPQRAGTVVIGGGAIGIAVALELVREGIDVLVLERDRIGEGATAGTAGMVTASHAERMANPSALMEGVRALPNPAGPLALRPTPRVVPWLARFTRASLDRGGARRGTDLLVSLAVESQAIHRAWNDEFGTGLVGRGTLNAYLTQAGLEHGLAGAEHHRALGLRFEVLDRAGMAAREPAVRGAIGAIWYPDDAHLDSLGFARHVGEQARVEGAVIAEGVEVHRLREEPAGIRLDTSSGVVVADRVVLAAGIGSKAIAPGIGIHAPMAGAKGYHVEFAGASPLETPVFLAETRVVATPLEGRIRLAGTLELGSPDGSVDMRRVEAIARAGAEHVDGLAGAARTAVWHGLRPMTPDGMPMVGRSPHSGRVVVATGHGMLGITLAPVTAHLVRRIVAGEPDDPRLASLAPGRFRRLRPFVG
jgi:D-amino-acid dehydrogenase